MQRNYMRCRVTIVRSAMAAKLPYKASVQVSTDADAIIWKTQQVLNECVLGKAGEGRTEAITNELSYQKREDGGLGHIHLATRHRAEWAALAGTLHDKEEPWRAIWWERLREIYGPLAEPGLEASTCSFKKCKEMTEASEQQRRAMEAWGSLPPPEAVMEQTEEQGEDGSGGRTRKSKRLAVFENLTGSFTVGGWNRNMVERQRIFFNTCGTREGQS